MEPRGERDEEHLPEEDRAEEIDKMTNERDDPARPEDPEPGAPSVGDAFRAGM